MSDTNTTPAVLREIAPAETHLAHPALSELRPAQRERDAFVEHVDSVLRPRGYRLLGAFLPARESAVAVAGFRLAESLAWGRHIYVDDLCTLAGERRRGHAGALLVWLAQEARRLGCAQLHLDSGTGPERFEAHRLYHAHGLSIHSHHFARSL
jgi:GNAT superfamily N-acetyltransferase